MLDLPHQELLRGLIRNDASLGRKLLHGWLSKQSIADRPSLASCAAALLLDHDPNTGVSAFLNLVRGHPDLAKQAFESRDYIYTRTAPIGSPDQLASLYIWLAQTYPPSEDPDHDGVHVIGPREQVASARDAVLNHLMTCGQFGIFPPGAIRRIGEELPTERWFARVEATAQEAVRRARWTPITLKELRHLAIGALLDPQHRGTANLGPRGAFTYPAAATRLHPAGPPSVGHRSRETQRRRRSFRLSARSAK